MRRQPSLVLTCPFCRRVNDQHAGPDQADGPEEGDCSLCWRCGMLSVYVGTPATSLRRPTQAELIPVLADPGVQAALAVLFSGETPAEVVENYRRAAGAL